MDAKAGDQREAAPVRRAIRLQFTLASLLMLMLLAAVGFWRLADYLDSRPLVWTPYTRTELDQQLQSRRIVLVWLRADWDAYSPWMAKEMWADPRLKREIRRHGVALLDVDYTDTDTPEPPLERGVTLVPLVVVYRDGESPRLLHLPTAEKVLGSIASELSGHNARVP